MADVIDLLKASAQKPGAVRDTPGYGPGLRVVPLNVSTRLEEVDEETGKKKVLGSTFQAPLPGDLSTAVDVLGEKVVFKYFVNALVVDLQSTERNKLVTAQPGEGRKKAKYLEELGL